LWYRDRNARSAELIGDCEAFLVGHVAERIEGRAASVPAWAWMNLLAHGSEHDLRSERAVVRPRQVTSGDEWRAARSYLAVEVLNLAAEFGPLADLQRRVLVPLEQRLASRPEVAGWRPCQWVWSVEAALDKHRQAWRRTMTGGTHPRR